MKRILSIQDISCFGKCSVTVALPLISAMGVECTVLPTAVLSAHTLFPDVVKTDLSGQLLPIARHFHKIGVSFDAICTGYLGSAEEVRAAQEIFALLGTEQTLLFVDPVMGDHGSFYRGFSASYAEENAALCGAADLIVPNLTEACLLTGTPYRTEYDRPYLEALLRKLTALGAKTAVVTGVSFGPGKTGIMGLDARSGSFFSYQNEQVPAAFHGTGDIFSSVSAAALVRGLPVREAFALAADFTAETIRETLKHPKDSRCGVDFELLSPALIRMLEERLSAAEKAD